MHHQGIHITQHIYQLNYTVLINHKTAISINLNGREVTQKDKGKHAIGDDGSYGASQQNVNFSAHRADRKASISLLRKRKERLILEG